MTAVFSGGSSHTMNLVLRILQPPARRRSRRHRRAVGHPSSRDHRRPGRQFVDPDTDAAVRMATTKGELDVILYQTLTPATVANFLGYANAAITPSVVPPRPGRFRDPGRRLQVLRRARCVRGGAAQPQSPTNRASELAGTIAMAKVGDNPDSATSEFFFSLGDNAANLDNQNGGFTVFGRVSASSLAGTLTTLAYVPVANYDVKLRSGGVTPSSRTSPSATCRSTNPAAAGGRSNQVDQDPFRRFVAGVSYAVTSPPNPSFATAGINGSNLEITGVAPGTTSLRSPPPTSMATAFRKRSK